MRQNVTNKKPDHGRKVSHESPNNNALLTVTVEDERLDTVNESSSVREARGDLRCDHTHVVHSSITPQDSKDRSGVYCGVPAAHSPIAQLLALTYLRYCFHLPPRPWSAQDPMMQPVPCLGAPLHVSVAAGAETEQP